MAEEDEVVTTSTSLEFTPTWAVAVVCFVLVSISILLKYLIHLFSKLLGERSKSLNQALYKIKSELMILGLISLLLAVTQSPISKICIPKSLGDTFLPCTDTILPTDIVEESTCEKKGKISLLSTTGVEHLQMFIFVLALFHVLSCLLTFTLGMAKMRRWKKWEEETRTLEYHVAHDPQRFRLSRETSFARRHLKFWSNHHILRWPACFIRQFVRSVSKTDYFILRHGFITAHFALGTIFDFQKFLTRALDDDFQVVVGVSPRVWIYAILFIFFNAHGFYSYYWLPFIPLVTLLLVGTKLQVVITRMCLESHDKSTVVRGTLLVKPDDNLFWFSRPQLLLHLMHFILFQNSFQLAFFVWTWVSIAHMNELLEFTELLPVGILRLDMEITSIVLSLVIGLLVQFLCGYVTLPLYALVTQMGSSMKRTVFTKRVIVGLKNWRTAAKRNVGTNQTRSAGPTPEPSPNYMVGTSLFHGKEFKTAVSDHPPGSGAYLNADVMEEQKIKSASNSDYDGELSFAWLRTKEKKGREREPCHLL